MTIFKYEMKQLKGSIVIWSAALAVCIFFMLPVYIEMLSNAGAMAAPGEFTGNSFFDVIGTNIEILSTPIGAYSFLTVFVLMASAINGMNLGLGIITKEYMYGTTDFLFTRPHRRSKIFVSKLLAAASAVFIIGIAYFIASWAGMVRGTEGNFDILPFALIAVSIIFMQLLFLTLGMLVGVVFPHIRTPIAIAVGVAFATYLLGGFSRKMGILLVGYFSPYIYFDGTRIILNNGYSSGYMIMFVALLLIFTITGHQVFCKKDVMLTS
ncbi:putative abc transporter, permease protein [hydrocarbon metagenome]|uniref:Putative abc transporter, permease protein n=1 Tax=hydrocarbon metagenome TaxID=938273 RepID=A0A0W8E630_9ZZZZ